MVKKFIQDNRVAVLYSPSYGSGWYTSWDDDRLDRLYDPEVVLWILHGRSEIILEALLKKYPRESERNLKDLRICWVNVGATISHHGIRWLRKGGAPPRGKLAYRVKIHMGCKNATHVAPILSHKIGPRQGLGRKNNEKIVVDGDGGSWYYMN